jgi:phosphoribosylaminoimidazolecarboxamide formyltransferase/IMP cyclohydrolase
VTESTGRAIKRALVSVYDKTGLEQLASDLHGAGVSIVSTGSTAKTIEASGVPVTPVEELTGFPECLDGRVKTLHPRVHAGILADSRLEDHVRQLEELEIEPFDLVVINLYPFRETVLSGATPDECVEQIDIGGPAMVRAAAKNHAYVAVVTDPADYDAVLNALELNSGSLSHEFRQKLAAKAFARTAAYDAAISNWFADALDIEHPAWRAFGGKLENVMRYGENPHQKAGFYVTGEKRPGCGRRRMRMFFLACRISSAPSS